MALVVRQALLRQRAFSRDAGMDQDALENRAALMREEDLRRIYDDDDQEDDNRELEEKRRKDAQELKQKLQLKKRQKISNIKKRMKVVDTIATILSLGSVLLAFIELEDNYSDDGKDRNVSSPQGHAMRAGISIATFFLLICVGKHHYFSYKIARERQTSSEGVGSTFAKSSSFRWMLFEMAYCAIHCPPGIDIEMTFEQLDGKLILSLDAICCCIMLLRIYILGRVVKHYNKFANDHADQICEGYGCEANTIFVLKSIFKEKPYVILGFSMAISILVFGFATRVFERPYSAEQGSSFNFDHVWNSMWLIVLTMTTVGYGDFFPQTHMGRFVVIIACFWGVFLVSMMVVTLTESSEFTKGESRAYDILSRLKAKEQATALARRVVKCALQLNVIKKKKRHDSHYNDSFVRKYNELMRELSKFRYHRSQWKKWELPVEEMLRQLNEKIDVDLDELKSQVSSVVEIEQQLQKVETFQEQSLDATKISILHLDELNGQLDKLLSGAN